MRPTLQPILLDEFDRYELKVSLSVRTGVVEVIGNIFTRSLPSQEKVSAYNYISFIIACSGVDGGY